MGFYQVTDTIHHTDKVVVNVILDGEWIETTPEHPFYVEGKGWVDAEDLKTGMRVYKADGTTGVVWLKWNVYKTQEMYNLTVDTAHTFFVGEGQWLVHNCGDLLSQLPERAGGKGPTTGILSTNGQQITFTSGELGPASSMGGKGSGFDAYTKTHAEGHAAAWMRQNNVTNATLYINNPPCANCARNLPKMLPLGSTLEVIGTNGYYNIFYGLTTLME